MSWNEVGVVWLKFIHFKFQFRQGFRRDGEKVWLWSRDLFATRTCFGEHSSRLSCSEFFGIRQERSMRIFRHFQKQWRSDLKKVSVLSMPVPKIRLISQFLRENEIKIVVSNVGIGLTYYQT